MNKFSNLSHPILVLVRGLPGSGKTHVAAALQASLGPDTVVMLDPDATNYESQKYKEHSQALTAEGIDAKFHPYRFLRAQAYDGITTNKIIIWNQPFTNFDGLTKTLVNLQNYASERNITMPVLIVEVDIDHVVAKERVVKRKQQGGHGPSENTFTRFTDEYKTFAGQGHQTVSVHGEDDVAASVATIIKALDSLLET